MIGQAEIANFRRFLQLGREFEEKMEVFYNLLAEVFAADATLKELFEKMAVEEAHHGRQFNFSAKMLDDMASGAAVDSAELDECIAHANLCMEEIRQKAPDALTALRHALFMEGKMHKFHMSTGLKFTDDKHRKFFNSLMKADAHHVTRLQDVLRQREKKPAQ